MYSDLFVCVYQPSVFRARGATDRGETPKVRPPPLLVSQKHSHALSGIRWPRLTGMGNRSTCAGQGRLTLGQFVSNLETPPPPHPLHMLTSVRHGTGCRAVSLLSRDDVGHRTKKLDIFRKMQTAVVLKL